MHLSMQEKNIQIKLIVVSERLLKCSDTRNVVFFKEKSNIHEIASMIPDIRESYHKAFATV